MKFKVFAQHAFHVLRVEVFFAGRFLANYFGCVIEFDSDVSGVRGLIVILFDAINSKNAIHPSVSIVFPSAATFFLESVGSRL